MSEIQRININYKDYKAEDQAELQKLDPTPKDQTLNSQDLLELSAKKLDKIYNIVRSYPLSNNGIFKVAANEERIISHVKKVKQSPEDYVRAAAKDNQFLLFGESHAATNTGPFFGSMIPILKQKGFDCLAMEIDYTQQAHVNKFLKTGDPKYLEDVKFINRKTLLAVLEAARKSGMSILCIDEPWSKKNDKGRMAVNHAMFDTINNRILSQNPNAKVAVYIGTNHIQEGESPSTELYSPLGYYLEKYAPGKSHSVVIEDDATLGLPEKLGKNISGNFAFGLDHPIIHTTVEYAVFKTTHGGSFDGMIVLQSDREKPTQQDNQEPRKNHQNTLPNIDLDKLNEILKR